MSYFDHLIAFPSRADALAALSKFTATDEDGDPHWSIPVFDRSGDGLEMITAEAVYSEPDPETGETTVVSPQEVLAGYWAILSLRSSQPGLPGVRLIANRDMYRRIEAGDAEAAAVGFLVHFAEDFDTATFESVVRFQPTIAGTQYPFGVTL